MQLGRSRSSVGHIERSTDEVGGIAKPASKPHSTSTAVGAPSSVLSTSSAERRGVDERQRRQHAALAEAVDEPALHRRADAAAGGERAGHHAGDRERAGPLAQVEDHRERVDADREAREQRRRDQRRDVRHAQDLRVAPHARRAPGRGRAPRRSSPASACPVNVFCWLGWKQPSSVPRSPAATRRRGRTRAAGAAPAPPSTAGVVSAAVQANAPRQSTTRTCSQQRQLALQPVARTRAFSLGSGLLAGGAQRTAAVMKQSRSSSPSSSATRLRLVGVAGAVQRRVQEVTGAVAGEHAPGAVGAVRGGRQAEHEHPRGRGRRTRGSGGPSTPSPRTTRASRGRPARATRRGAGSGGSRRSRLRARRGRRSRRRVGEQAHVSRSTTGSSSEMSAGRPVRICRDASSTTAPAIANASCGEAKRGAAPRAWSRRLSSSMYCATASSARSRRAIARGPAPTISTSSVCASSGNCSSAPRNASAEARTRSAGRRPCCGRPPRASPRGSPRSRCRTRRRCSPPCCRSARRTWPSTCRPRGRSPRRSPLRSRRARTRLRPPRTAGGAAGPAGPRAAGRVARGGPLRCGRATGEE